MDAIARFWGVGRAAALMLLPAMAALATVSVYPVIEGLWLSFRNTSLIFRTDKFLHRVECILDAVRNLLCNFGELVLGNVFTAFHSFLELLHLRDGFF